MIYGTVATAYHPPHGSNKRGRITLYQKVKWITLCETVKWLTLCEKVKWITLCQKIKSSLRTGGTAQFDASGSAKGSGLYHEK